MKGKGEKPCEMSPWSAWGDCSVSCGVGVQKSVRNIMSEDKNCNGLTTRSRSCTEKPCSLAGLKLSQFEHRPAGYALFDPYPPGPPPGPGSYYGVDVSEPTSSGAFSCLVGEGYVVHSSEMVLNSCRYTFAVVRAYESVGQPDPNAPGTIAAAWDGGCSNVDV